MPLNLPHWAVKSIFSVLSSSEDFQSYCWLPRVLLVFSPLLSLELLLLLKCFDTLSFVSAFVNPETFPFCWRLFLVCLNAAIVCHCVTVNQSRSVLQCSGIQSRSDLFFSLHQCMKHIKTKKNMYIYITYSVLNRKDLWECHMTVYENTKTIPLKEYVYPIFTIKVYA